MKIPKRPSSTQEFVLSIHLDKDTKKPIEGAPIFKIKPLPVGVFDDVQDMQLSGESLAGSETVALTVRRSKSFRIAAKSGLVGWENVEDENGKPIEFRNFHDVDTLPDEWVYEIGAQCYLISRLTETEKN